MPKGRRYLPFGLTAAEKRSPSLKRKLSSCIRSVEKRACPKRAKKDEKFDYSKCEVNPVKVCRASLMRKYRYGKYR